MTKSSPAIPLKDFKAFVRVVRRLRRDCPWDRKQTHKSLRHALIEETYEVVEALDAGDMRELSKELGDLLLHIILQATIAEQAGEFSLRDVFTQEQAKLIRRHPHVFGTVKAGSAEDVKQNWERLKMKEGRSSVLEGVPGSMPALIRALRVQQRAAKVGFDWENEDQVWKKVREELEEVREALRGGKHIRREQEFGDLLFALVNYARFLRINPENALRGTIDTFTRRFQYIERELAKRGKTAHDSSLEEMDALWDEAKTRRRLPPPGGRKKAGAHRLTRPQRRASTKSSRRGTASTKPSRRAKTSSEKPKRREAASTKPERRGKASTESSRRAKASTKR